MKGSKYLKLLNVKLRLLKNVHQCTMFMKYGATCHTSDIASA